MPRNKKNRGGKPKKGDKNQHNPFGSAPRQGIGATEDWQINDLQVVTFPQAVNPGFYTVRVSCDCNGFSWTVSDSGTLINSFPGTTYFQYQQAYGTANNQFSRLSLLWEQYRVDAIEMEVIPSGASGFMNSTGVFSLIDECDLLNGYQPLGDLIPKLSSQRTLEMASPYKAVKRRLNLRKWIGQTQQKAWLQTQQAGTTQLVREQYVTQWVDPANNSAQAKTPALCMVFGVNTLQSVATIVASVRFRAKLSFRQRAALDNGPVAGSTISIREDDSGRIFKDVSATQTNTGDQEETKSDQLTHLGRVRGEVMPQFPLKDSDLTKSQLCSLINGINTDQFERK